MIFTRFGSPVEIIRVMKSGMLKVRYHRTTSTAQLRVTDLKADGGIREIEDAIDKIKESEAIRDKHNRFIGKNVVSR